MMIQTMVVSVCAIASVLGLPGCGGILLEPADVRAPWRGEAEEMCLRSTGIEVLASGVKLAPIDGPGSCGALHPIKVTEAANGVTLSPGATLSCPMIPAVNAWLNETVQPAARVHLGVAVSELSVAASYVCRNRNNQKRAKKSEHAYANAIDISAFVTRDGRRITVRDGWQGAEDEKMFLRKVHKDACIHFTTVLGPDGDKYHQDHFHFDLAKRGRKGNARYCR